MTSHEDDLDLLLSLQDRVPDTPPASPTPGSITITITCNSFLYAFSFLCSLLIIMSIIAGYLSDDDSLNQREKSDMSVFKNAVQDCLPYDPPKPPKPTNKPVTNDSQLEKFSGLRIRFHSLRFHFSYSLICLPVN